MAQPIWNTPAGSLATAPAQNIFNYPLSASPVSPAIAIVSYTLLSGTLPSGLVLGINGMIVGTPTIVTEATTSEFAVRVTDDLGNIRDRTFSITITGNAVPSITTPSGTLLSTLDSVWVYFQINYSNPKSSNPIEFSVLEGSLPPGLEIDNNGLIRGYPKPPIGNISFPLVITGATNTSDSNYITCFSTIDFTVGRAIIFSGTTIGGIIADQTYYIKSILTSTTFTISNTQNGAELDLNADSGYMTITLPATTIGEPIIRTYSFSLKLDSPLGSDSASYSITVINQNTPIGANGPGFPENTRIPTIYNTRPPTFNINDTDPYYRYYIQPTVQPTTYAEMGTYESDNYFAFKIIGHDFDNNPITYSFVDLPLGMTGDPDTGWVTGTPIIPIGFETYEFSVAVYKTNNPTIISPYFNFTYNISNTITGVITWVTPSDLGTVYNGTISTLSVVAE